MYYKINVLFISDVYDVVVDELPKFKSGGDKPSCDICIKKGKDVPAVMYCTICTKKHCKKHKEVIVLVIIGTSITLVLVD